MPDVNYVVIHGKERKLDWKPDKPDIRDYKFNATLFRGVPTPDVVNLTDRCSPVDDQGRLGSCFDKETEVLTETGWRLFSDLTGEECLATVDPKTRKAIFEKPVRLFRYPYVGNLIRVSNKSLDFAVTPNHNMLVRKWDQSLRTLGPVFEFVRADELGWYSGLMGSFETASEGQEFYELPARLDAKLKKQRQPRHVPMAAWLRFLGIYLAEGTICYRKPKEGRILGERKIQIAGVKEREREFIEDTLFDLGIENPCILEDRFTFHDMQIVQALFDLGLGGVKAGKKFVPDFVFNQSAENIRQFLLGHFMGDGCEGITPCHYTSSKELSDDLHALLLLSGNQSRVTVREARAEGAMMADGRVIRGTLPEHRISVVQGRSDPSIERKRSVFEEFYAGEVFCAEVPTYHTLVTRRNGKVLVAGNCTGHALAGQAEFEWSVRPPGQRYKFSRQFIYYNERKLEGTIREDSGAYIRDGIKTLASDGVCFEKTWPYVDSMEEMIRQPSPNAYKEAATFRIGPYYRLSGLDSMLDCLAQGHTFTFGIMLYESFQAQTVARTGVVPMPKSTEQILGGHAVTAVGYSKPHKLVMVRNSWGIDWGAKGYFFLPFDYVANNDLTDDSWTFRAAA